MLVTLSILISLGFIPGTVKVATVFLKTICAFVSNDAMVTPEREEDAVIVTAVRTKPVGYADGCTVGSDDG